MLTSRNLAHAALLATAFAGLAEAQSNRVLRSHTSRDTTGTPDSFGAQIVSLGDIDGDMFDDYAISAPLEFAGSDATDNAGAVHAYSGQTGLELWIVTGTAGWTDCSGARGQDELGTALATVPDVTGDGVVELLVGAPGAGVLSGGCLSANGQAFLLNGASGAILQTYSGQNRNERFGQDVDTVRGNALIMTPGGTSPRVEEFSSTGGGLIFNHSMAGMGPMIAIVGAGDQDGNGVAAEFATSFQPTLTAPPQVTLTDAVTGFLLGAPILQAITDPSSLYGFDLDVLPGAGAIGNDVLLIAEPFFDTPTIGDAGQIVAFDFNTGLSTQFAVGTGNDGLGFSNDVGGDFDADGIPDVVTVAIVAGEARMLPGAGGAATPLTGTGGPVGVLNAAFVGDTSNLGFSNIAINIPTFPNGQVDVMSGGPSASIVPVFGPGCARAPGGLAVLTQNSPQIPGTSTSFTGSVLTGYDLLILQVGFPDPVGTVLPSLCTLWLAGSQSVVTVPSLGGATTFTTASFPTPQNLGLLGTTFGFQLILLPAGGGLGQLATSNAVSSTIGW